jgi:hypothetical protein
MKWSEEQISFLRENYPIKGRDWCAKNMNLTTGQIRTKASRLQLKAMGLSDAWMEGQIKAAKSKIGKKRPDHSEVMKNLHKSGLGSFALFTQDQRKKTTQKMWARKKLLDPEWHPRGMMGKKHTDECKELIGKKSKKAWQKMTAQKKQERSVKIAKTRDKNGTYVNSRPHATWKGGWREIGGINKYYRSRWEANYARYLQWLKELGEISSWSHEPKVFWFEGVKRGTVSYLPDFCVVEKNGEEVYHEVKGWMDKRSVTKLKRMKKYHPSVRMVLITAKEYKAISMAVSALIKNWE